MGTFPDDPMPTGHPLLLGRFYPEYDIPVIILSCFMIIAGASNWMVVWCILKTKPLRNPFNMIVLALSVSNGVDTSIVGPMDLIRIIMLYTPNTTAWCDVRVLLKTICFTISTQIIFSVSAMRLTAALRKKYVKLTHNTVRVIIFVICVVAFTVAPIMLDKTSSTYRSCLGNFNNDTLQEILKNEGLWPSTIKLKVPKPTIEAFTNNQVSSATTKQTIDEFVTTNIGLVVPKNASQLWLYYLIFTGALFTGTVTCYIGLIIVLMQHRNRMQFMTLGNSRDILTMRITCFVTIVFFISFLLPFLPAIVRPRAQNTAAALHYISIYHCLTSIDGTLTPLIFFFANKVYKKTLIKILPNWAKRILCYPVAQVAPTPVVNALPSPYVLNMATAAGSRERY